MKYLITTTLAIAVVSLAFTDIATSTLVGITILASILAIAIESY